MEQYIIKGGAPLSGDVEIGGAKNAALGILAASIMTDETVLIENVPDVRDTKVMMQAMESIKRTRTLCTVVTSAFALSGMLLSEFTATEDESSQSGWQGTLTFTQYQSSAAVQKTNDNSSAAKHTGSTGQIQSVTGDALKQMLARAGVN